MERCRWQRRQRCTKEPTPSTTPISRCSTCGSKDEIDLYSKSGVTGVLARLQRLDTSGRVLGYACRKVVGCAPWALARGRGHTAHPMSTHLAGAAGASPAHSVRFSCTHSLLRHGGQGYVLHEREQHRSGASDAVVRQCVLATRRVQRFAALRRATSRSAGGHNRTCSTPLGIQRRRLPPKLKCSTTRLTASLRALLLLRHCARYEVTC